MYPTPLYSHAGRGPFIDVYEPAEDSFLLIDALEQDAEKLKQMRWNPPLNAECLIREQNHIKN